MTDSLPPEDARNAPLPLVHQSKYNRSEFIDELLEEGHAA